MLECASSILLNDIGGSEDAVPGFEASDRAAGFDDDAREVHAEDPRESDPGEGRGMCGLDGVVYGVDGYGVGADDEFVGLWDGVRSVFNDERGRFGGGEISCEVERLGRHFGWELVEVYLVWRIDINEANTEFWRRMGEQDALFLLYNSIRISHTILPLVPLESRTSPFPESLPYLFQ